MTRQAYHDGALVNWYRSKMQKIEAGTEEAMQDAGQAGKDLGRLLIETRGTGRTWAYPRNGRAGSIPGRVDTAKMRDAFGFRLTTQGGSRQVRVGWVSGTREEYFKFQEGGFTHVNGIDVEGMHALQDAVEEAFEQLKANVRKEIKRA